jgi:hypothetical protein
VDGGRDVVFERNIAHNCNIGFEMASEHKNRTTKNIAVRNNLIYDNHVIGLAIGGYDKDRGKTMNCTIVNNSFYNNNTDDLGWGAEILIQYYCSDNLFENNIIYAAENKPYLLHQSGSGSNNSFDYNLYYGGGYWNWEGTEYSLLSNLQSASGQEAHSLVDDPMFAEKEKYDFRILDYSPARDAGDNLTSAQIGTADFAGNDRIINNVVDLGAYEHDGGAAGFRRSNKYGVSSFSLLQNYPNPFNPLTTIPFSIEKEGWVELTVSSVLGQKIGVLISGDYKRGKYSVTWDGASFPSGIYFYQLKNNDGVCLTRKFILLK